MALRNPPSWLQNGSHPAENDRLTAQAAYATTGIIDNGGLTALKVTAQASPNMTVNIATGYGAIVGTTQANMGTYVFFNDATVVATITTADVLNPRIDRIVATVQDAFYSGSNNQVVFTVIAGTPAASPVAPTTPANSLSLATIAVAANTTTITSGNITDTRVQTTTNMPVLQLAGGTLTGNLTTMAGTTAIAPLVIPPGTNLTTAQTGAVEFDGGAFYMTPQTSSGRAAVSTDWFYALNANRNLTAGATTAQDVFGVSLTLPVGVYEVETWWAGTYVQSSTTALSTTVALGGTATKTLLTTADFVGGASSQAALVRASTTASFVPANTVTAATQFLDISTRSLVRVTGAGTFNVTLTFGGTNYSAATILANSYIRVRPVSVNSTTQAVGAWA